MFKLELNVIVDYILLVVLFLICTKIAMANKKLFRKYLLLIFLVVIYAIVKTLDLPHTTLLLEGIVQFLPLVFFILFYEEISMVFERMNFKFRGNSNKEINNQIVKKIIGAVENLATKRIGGTLTFERRDKLTSFIENAIELNADIGEEIIEALFNVASPTHDGGVIIRKDKMLCCGAYYPYPINANSLPKTLGSRHRSAIGVSELYDCLTIVVSEETGKISITFEGDIEQHVSRETLKMYLDKYLL